MRLRFDTTLDEGRIEEGVEINPIEGGVAAVSQGDTRPTFHLMPDGSVTLVSKTGRRVPNFGENGEVL